MMNSVLRMSEDELAKLEAGLGFRSLPAFGIAATTSVLALAGMALRYSPGDNVPLAGMDNISGQCVLAGTLGVSMMVAAWLVRSVIMKRLQWGVLLSLVIHLVLCFVLHTVQVNVPVVLAAEIGTDNLPLQEFTMPDYGGAESLTSPEQQQWERPTDVDVQEAEQQQLERQDAEIEIDVQPEQVLRQEHVAAVDVPMPQREQEQMQQERELELQRQMQQAQANVPEQLETPQVTTQQSQQPELEARRNNRMEANPQNSQRRMETVERRSDEAVSEATVRFRAEVRPTEMLQAEMTPNERAAAEAAIADSTAEAVDVAAAAAARPMTTEAQALEVRRQSEADPVSSQSADNSAPASSSARQVESLNPARATSADMATADAVPSSGGATSLQRSTTSAGQSTSAAETSAQSVSVATAERSGSPELSATAAASNVARGNSSVPTGSAGAGGAPAMQSSLRGVTALQSGSVGQGRGTGAGRGPQLGQSVANPSPGGGRGQRSTQHSQVGAVGTQATQVQVAGVAASSGAAGRRLASGPATSASNVARNGGGLPASVTRGSGTESSAAPSGTRGRGVSVAMRTEGRSGGSGRSTNATARLGGVLGGRGITGSSSGRSAAAASLPAGSLAAEEVGALVIAGPQAPSGSSGGGGRGRSSGLDGPRIASLARSSAGLPGMSRGGSTSVGRTRSSLPGAFGASGLPSRAASRAGGPRLASESDVAGMIRRSISGISAIATERVSPGFSMRTPEARVEAVEKLGGNDISEAAVERGLEWLAAHQYAAGNWSIHEMNCRDHDCTGHGIYQADPAATGLALLVFLGAGNTHTTGKYQAVVDRGLQWLIERQTSAGDLFAAESEFAGFYSHGIAAIALCEAFGMTKDKQLREPAQRAINYIVASQHPKFGGWRYQPQFESDTSVSGWQLMALKSGEMAGLKIPDAAYAGVKTWLDSVEDSENAGRFSYHPTKEVTPSMTAEGLLMRQYLGARRDNSAVQAGASYLRQRLPRSESRDVYYWYYATQVMFHMQGDHWAAWNAALRDSVVESQEKGGPVRGSWSPELPTKDMWGRSGGRHYVTCLNLLMLEVYYRHLPLYIELDR